MKTVLFGCVLVLTISALAFGGQKSRFFLFDGTTIEGEVLSFLNGIYTIDTDSQGQVKIGASKIRKMEAIETPEPAASASPVRGNQDAPMRSEIDKISSTITSNPGMSGQVASLAADPSIQALLNDPEIVAAVKAGDIKALMANPKFMELVNNQKIKELSNQVKDAQSK